jgi:hypothetical protein
VTTRILWNPLASKKSDILLPARSRLGGGDNGQVGEFVGVCIGNSCVRMPACNLGSVDIASGVIETLCEREMLAPAKLLVRDVTKELAGETKP